MKAEPTTVSLSHITPFLVFSNWLVQKEDMVVVEEMAKVVLGGVSCMITSKKLAGESCTASLSKKASKTVVTEADAGLSKAFSIFKKKKA